MDFDEVRALALELPGVEESTSYGTPAFKLKGKLLARLHQDGDQLVVRADFDAREALIAARPKWFSVTDHYRDHRFVRVRFEAVSRSALAEVLEEAWRSLAPKRLREARESTG